MSGAEALFKIRQLEGGRLEVVGWRGEPVELDPQQLGAYVVQSLADPELPLVEQTGEGNSKVATAVARVLLPDQLGDLAPAAARLAQDAFNLGGEAVRRRPPPKKTAEPSGDPPRRPRPRVGRGGRIY